MKKQLKTVLLALLGVLVVIQFFQIDKTNSPYDPSQDIIAQLQPPQQVAELLKSACYDCHSYETKYPWYTYIQPVGWWIKNHIEEGSKHLNFSIWGTYTPRRKDRKLEEIVEEVKTGHMPFASYTWVHSEARLTYEQRQSIVNWADEARRQLGYQPAAGEEPLSGNEGEVNHAQGEGR
ncbi:MAG: heme-binding protein [Saprospiraceae bacterium]|nr:MAG: heme-binding protein [Saprospiraceae bacterium]